MTRTATILGLLVALAPGARAAELQHEPPACVVAGRPARLGTCALHPQAYSEGRIYFHEQGRSDWYFVDTTREAGCFWGLLPKTRPGVRHVVYYLDVRGPEGAAARTPETTLTVVASGDRCPGKGVAPVSPVDPAFVGANAGAPLTPSGFGEAGGGGGKLLLIGGGLAGAAGAAVALGGGGGGGAATTPTPDLSRVPATPTTAATPTATSTSEPSPTATDPPARTKAPAPTATQPPAATATETPAATATSKPGKNTPTATATATGTSTATARATSRARSTATATSTPTATARARTTATATASATATDAPTATPTATATTAATATATATAGNFRDQARANAPPLAWSSELTGARHARLIVNGEALADLGPGTSTGLLRARAGENRVELEIVDAVPGQWLLRLRGVAVTPGSLHPLAGAGLPAGDAIVFRLTGRAGERVAFAFVSR